MLSKALLALAAGTLAAAQDSGAASESVDGAAERQIVLAEPEDFRAGAEVRDPDGGPVGTIEAVDDEGAVIATGEVRVRMPFASFGKDERGLVISLTRAELEARARAQVADR